jgi:hypothetical protein
MDAERLARLAETFMARAEVPVARGAHGEHAEKTIDARKYVLSMAPAEPALAEKLGAALEWGPPGQPPAMLVVRVLAGGDGSVRPSELVRALGFVKSEIARLGLMGITSDGAVFDPLDPPLAAPRADAHPDVPSAAGSADETHA